MLFLSTLLLNWSMDCASGNVCIDEKRQKIGRYFFFLVYSAQNTPMVLFPSIHFFFISFTFLVLPSLMLGKKDY